MKQEGLDISSSETPLISVLMPVYNGKAFLKEAIESVLQQTYPHFEFIIIDDGSTDATPKILQHFVKTDSRLHVFRQKNSGIVAALNAGLDHCQGKYIARMDADDICYPERLEIQMNYLEADNTLALVGGQADIIDAEGQNISQGGGEPGRQHKATNMRRFPPQVADSLHPLIMMQARAIKAIGGYRSDYPHAEDYDMFIRISSQGRIFNPEDIVLKYRIHGDSISQKHMALQELSASRAELVAMWALRTHDTVNAPTEVPPEDVLLKDTNISQTAFRAYQNYRLWKRTEISHLHAGGDMRKKMLRAVLNLHPKTLFDLSYWQIRTHIFATFVYRFLKHIFVVFKN